MKLNYTYIDSDVRPELRIEGLQPMYFEGRDRRTRRWMFTQHSNGRIYEASFCAALINLVAALQPKVILDIGAFLGYFTIMSAAASKNDTRIFAFEMNEENYKLVCSNIVANKHLSPSRMIPICAGVTDISSYAQPITIRGFQMFEGTGDTLDQSKVHNKDFSNASESCVDFLAVDDFCARHNVVPDLIKMDIEGWECKALVGARQTIRDHRPTMLVEIHSDRKLQEFDMDQRAVIKSLADEGYEICLFGDHKQRGAQGAFLAHLTPEQIDRHVEGDNTAVVAVVPEKLSKLESLIVR